MLRHVPIPGKLTLGFGILIVALLVVAFVALYNLYAADSNYVHYRQLARLTNANGRVQANMLTTRINAKNFVIDPTDEHIAGVNDRAMATLELIDDARALSDNVAFQVMLDSIHRDLDDYLEHFEHVTRMQGQRDELVRDVLNGVGPQIERKLTAIMKRAAADGDTESSYLAGLALRSLLLARLYTNRFLVRNDDPSYQRTSREFVALDSDLDRLQAVLQGRGQRALLVEVRAQKAQYQEAFLTVHGLVVSRNDIIRNYLDRIGPDVAEELEKLKLAIQAEQDALGPAAAASLQLAMQVTLAIAVAATLLGIGAAWLIGLGISRPLSELTRAATAMGRGDLAQDVDVRRGDELGRLARAFAAMREAIEEQVKSLQAGVEERLEAEREASDRRQVFMDAADPIVIEDLNGIVTDVNREAVRVYGYPRTELIGKPIKTLVPDELHPETDELRMKSTAGYEVRGVQSVRWNVKGERFDVELTFSRLQDEHGRMTAIASIAKDITKEVAMQAELNREREQLESAVKSRTAELEEATAHAEALRDQAQAATQAKANFLASMSHEIRTPMNGIVGMVDLLLQSEVSSDQRDMLSTMRSSGTSLVSIINEILDFSKIEAGKMELEAAPTSVLDVVDGVAATLSPMARDKSLRLRAFVDPRIPTFLTADATRLRQVLTNLLGNAIKFTETGEVALRAEYVEADSEGVAVRFRVIDQGIGIPEEKQSELFQAFGQVEASTTRKYGGTGLGLSISDRLVQLMGGRIEVESEVGVGSEFHFAVHFPSSDQQPAQAPLEDLRGVVALLVGAVESDLADCRTYLEHWDAHVDVVAGAVDPVAAIRDYVSATPNLHVVILAAAWSAERRREIYEGALREVAELKVPVLRLFDGRRTHARLESAGGLVLDVSPMRRVEFLTAVAVALGRASPEVYDNEQPQRLAARQAPSVKEALALNALVLVAEDNETNRMVIARQLAVLGYACELRVDGVEALEAWQTGRYAIVLTDCHMPNMDGYELTRRIRELEQDSARRAPIIAVTANALSGEEARCQEAGMDDYISKPLDLLRLKEKLEQWLPNFRPQAAGSASGDRGSEAA